METVIYYNPRCSKCRQTLALIRERGIEPTIVSYLEDPPDSNALGQIIEKLGIDPRGLIRFKEAAARKLGLARGDERSKAAWIGILVQNPGLLERPIVVRGNRAVLARPPERFLEIL